MVFHWSLSDSMSSQNSRTLLSILTDLNNFAVWMVSIRPLIFNSPSPFTKPLGIIPSASITTGITFIFMSHSFLVFWQGLSTYNSFRFLSFSLCGLLGWQNSLFGSFFFCFFDCRYVWWSGRDKVICLYIKVSEKFVRFILQNWL